jgi:hypothetical protein
MPTLSAFSAGKLQVIDYASLVRKLQLTLIKRAPVTPCAAIADERLLLTCENTSGGGGARCRLRLAHWGEGGRNNTLRSNVLFRKGGGKGILPYFLLVKTESL